jgi:uncharacterized protein
MNELASLFPLRWPALLALGTGLAGAAFLVLVAGTRRTALEREPWVGRAEFALRRAASLFLRGNRGERWRRWALEARNPDLAVAFLEEGARLGDREAQFELGLYLEEGGQGPGGRDQAARHYRAAAEAGHPEAAFRLAELMRWGIGPTRDPDAALRWYLRSAHAGFQPAMVWLMKAFEGNDGVPEDLEQAVAWTVRVRATPPVRLRLSRIAGKRPTFSWTEPHPEAVPPEPRSQDRPEEAWFRLGMGLLGGPDPALAQVWLQRAAEAGHLEAMAQLAALLESGCCGPDRAEDAQVWFRRAGALGHAGAQTRLGTLAGR